MNKPNRVILHCAATPDYPATSPDFNKFTLKDIDRWHRERGWNGCGYHWVVGRPGQIEIGRDPSVMGAHTSGHNHNSLGICLIGTKEITREQVVSLLDLYRYIKSQYNITWASWFGHYELNSKKTCPGLPMALLRAFLKGSENGINSAT